MMIACSVIVVVDGAMVRRSSAWAAAPTKGDGKSCVFLLECGPLFPRLNSRLAAYL